MRLWAIPLVLALAGCASVAEGEPAPIPSTAASDPNDDQNEGESGGVQPTGTPTVVATGLEAPWSMVRLESGSTLISQRDTATIVELQVDGTSREVGAVPGVVPGGEGGLLGLEVVPEGPWLYAYFTSADDNRIVRFSSTVMRATTPFPIPTRCSPDSPRRATTTAAVSSSAPTACSTRR